MISQFAKALRVVQVSDCHVSGNPETAYRGQDADGNLAALLPVIEAWQPELLLLSGDVSEDSSAASYQRVSTRLKTLGVPVLALPGNHDEPAVMSRYFGAGPWGEPFEFQARRWGLLLLDSTVADRVSGELATRTLDQLKSCLDSSTAEHILVALHHQPGRLPTNR